MNTLKTLFFIILFVEKNNKSAGREEFKLIYEKDVSEHCRRRVMPSIFLGRQVIEANARIIQFSSLELPYSCSVSIRTESGSSMVMMIQVMSTEIQEACRNSAQLLVYEMGESFGGYWGPMPESVIRREPLPPTAYTLKTTELTIPTTESLEEEEEKTETTETSTASSEFPSEHLTGDYVVMEIPLLNVSAHNVPSLEIQTEYSNIVNSFDLNQDVTPIKGVAYESSLIPLVQFRFAEQAGERGNDGDEAPKYKLDILQDFTPDIRLTMPQLNPTTKRRHKQKSTRRLIFKKHRTLFHSQHHPQRRVMSETTTKKLNTATKYLFPTKKNFTNNKRKNHRDSWRAVEDLLKKLNKSKARILQTTLSVKDENLLERISNTEHKISAYLSSNLSKYDSNNSYNDTKIYSTSKDASYSTRQPVSFVTNASEEPSKEPVLKVQTRSEIKFATVENIGIQQRVNLDEISKSSDAITESSNTKDGRSSQELPPASKSSRIDSTEIVEFGKSSISETETHWNIRTGGTIISNSQSTERFLVPKNKLNKTLTGTMVGHESWENLVQAAPEMAVFLNQTVADVVSRAKLGEDHTKEINEAAHKNKMLKRKKRDIHSIAIANAHPRNVTTRKIAATTTQLTFDVADMQEFAQLVELQDDEMNSRVALRNVNQFIGPPFFQLCDIADPTKPHVHLFNSSRIILAPSNFTLDRMVIILTAARALLSGELRCPRAKIECQVAGARVCLDSMVACDGVPNCGSYDIYDEDRLMCGQSAAQQHNVYLAAFTLLAVLLTVMYAVHYWLKRCVPNVADAFFVYSDGVENILYLDSVMRSPHDIGETPKMVYHSHLYGDENIYDNYIKEPLKNTCQRFLRKLLCCFRNTPNKIEEKFPSHMHLTLSMPRKTYSFTEIEIRKILASFADTAVQTGESLEMRPLENARDNKTVPLTGKPPLRPTATSFDFKLKTADSLLTLEEPLPEEHVDELSLLKFFKAAARMTAQRNETPDVRTESIESASKRLPRENKLPEPHNRVGTPSEREIEIHSYDRYGLPEPGPSTRVDGGGQIASTSSVSKHLRFDVVTTTIPPGRYTEEDNDGIKNADSRRSVVLGENICSSRILDTIQEADEPGGGKEHRRFWGSSKGKKTKKKTHVSLR